VCGVDGREEVGKRVEGKEEKKERRTYHNTDETKAQRRKEIQKELSHGTSNVIEYILI
jgi:hypothetical protein